MSGLTAGQSAVVADVVKKLGWVRSGRDSQARNLKWLDEAVEAAREANVPEAILEAIAGDDLPIAAVSEKEETT